MASKWRKLSKIERTFLPEWTKEDIVEGLVEAVTMHKKQEKRKTSLFVENDLQNRIKQSHSNAIKRNKIGCESISRNRDHSAFRRI